MSELENEVKATTDEGPVIESTAEQIQAAADKLNKAIEENPDMTREEFREAMKKSGFEMPTEEQRSVVEGSLEAIDKMKAGFAEDLAEKNQIKIGTLSSQVAQLQSSISAKEMLNKRIEMKIDGSFKLLKSLSMYASDLETKVNSLFEVLKKNKVMTEREFEDSYDKSRLLRRKTKEPIAAGDVAWCKVKTLMGGARPHTQDEIAVRVGLDAFAFESGLIGAMPNSRIEFEKEFEDSDMRFPQYAGKKLRFIVWIDKVKTPVIVEENMEGHESPEYKEESELTPDQMPKVANHLKLTLGDEQSGNELNTKLEIYSTDPDEVRAQVLRAVGKLLTDMGFAPSVDKEIKCGTAAEENSMGDDENEKAPEQTQDLTHQKPEETDNLQKSADPAGDYMDKKGLDQDTHGLK